MESLKHKFTNTFARLPGEFFRQTRPTPLDNCHLVNVNEKMASKLGITPHIYQSRLFIDVFNGVQTYAGFTPIATVYAGHQFGTYVPQLGDGRAILLGEMATGTGEPHELQAKGAGLTHYSRSGDGRAVLRSTIREYLCSSAMYGLGIPTTQALCLMASTTEVYRETIEKAALLIRVAPSFIRFGSFEYFHYQSRPDLVKKLADYTIQKYFPQAIEQANPYGFFFQAVVTRTAELMAKWQAVGFAHGVMNTDNMSILGLTLDYGPFGFLDNYDPKYICNHSDDSGRYAFNRQPSIALWNLRHLAEALTSLNSMESMTEILNTYSPSYSQHLFTLMRNKLGLKEANRRTLEIVNDLFSLLEKNQPDYTRFFRSLSQFEQETKAENPIVRNQFIDRAAFNAWSIKYKQQLVSENSDNQKRAVWLNKNNPKYILRNHLAQQAIEKANDGDYSEISILQKLLHNPFDEHDDHDKYADLPPEWAKKISISCSS